MTNTDSQLTFSMGLSEDPIRQKKNHHPEHKMHVGLRISHPVCLVGSRACKTWLAVNPIGFVGPTNGPGGEISFFLRLGSLLDQGEYLFASGGVAVPND